MAENKTRQKQRTSASKAKETVADFKARGEAQKFKKTTRQIRQENALFDHPQNQKFREQSLSSEVKRRQKFGRGSKISPAFRRPEPPHIDLSPDPNKRTQV